MDPLNPRISIRCPSRYVLPRKYLIGLDDKEAVAAALAKTLERLGGQAAGYAEVCRAPETQRLLRAWEVEDPVAPRTFRDLLDSSGIEPPDTADARRAVLDRIADAVSAEPPAIGS